MLIEPINKLAGNVTNDGVNTWVYDAENRIVSRNSGTDQFQYDHANRRIKKTSSASGAAIHYVWQGSQVIAEHNSNNGSVIVDYIYAGGRMIAKEEGGRSFFLNDRLSVRAVITDGQGGIQGRQSHLPFGEEIALTGQQEKGGSPTMRLTARVRLVTQSADSMPKTRGGIYRQILSRVQRAAHRGSTSMRTA